MRSVLPAASLPGFLRGLAEGWRDLTGAEIALVSCFLPSESRLQGCLIQGECSVKSIDLDFEGAADWQAQQVQQKLAGVVPDEGRLTQAIPFLEDGWAIGGVLLVSPSQTEWDAAYLSEFADLSACLIRQSLQWGDVCAVLANDERFRDAKLEALAEFAAGAGHEINNPVATIAGRVQLLLQGETDPERRQALATIGGQAYRIRDMIGDVMLYARPPQPAPQHLDLNEVVRSVVGNLTEESAAQGGTIRIPPPENGAVPIWADHAQLCIVISSLVRNSLEAMPHGGQVGISTESRRNGGDLPQAVLSVSDNGRGVDDLQREHLFDPFFSGRQAGRGLGFGLSKCWRIVSNHGGRIEVESEPDVGTTFTVYWPAEADETINRITNPQPTPNS